MLYSNMQIIRIITLETPETYSIEILIINEVKVGTKIYLKNELPQEGQVDPFPRCRRVSL